MSLLSQLTSTMPKVLSVSSSSLSIFCQIFLIACRAPWPWGLSRENTISQRRQMIATDKVYSHLVLQGVAENVELRLKGL